MHEYIPLPAIQPDIFLGGLRISEPVTSFTALMISVLSFWAWRRLGRTGERHWAIWFMRGFFILLSISTLVSTVIGHAFLYKFSFEWKAPGWVLGMAGITALERAAILHARPLLKPVWGYFFSVLNIVEFIVFLVLVLSTLNFHFVELHAGLGLAVIVGLFEGYVWQKKRDTGSLFILSSIPVAAIAVIAHLAYFSFSVWFTYFDIGHIMMCICIPLMLHGAEKMKFYEGNT